jgi:hypothetical protein
VEATVVLIRDSLERGVHEALQFVAANVRVNAPADSLMLELEPSLKARPVEPARLRLVAQAEQALRNAMMEFYAAGRK